MRKKVFIILSVILAISTHLFAYTDGQIVHFDGNHYTVISAAKKIYVFWVVINPKQVSWKFQLLCLIRKTLILR